MSELVSFNAIRGAQSLSPKEIDEIGIKTHPEYLRSERYLHWLTLCERKEHDRLYSEMENFLKSDESIKTYNQISKEIQSVIKFPEYNGYKKFGIKDFTKQIDLRKIANEFGKEIKDTGCYDHESPFFKLITNLNDQLLAITQFNWTVNYEFDLQGAIKSLKLAEKIYLNGKDKVQVKIEKHYAKPLILNSCILEIDPCSLLPIYPNKRKDDSDKNKDANTNSDGTRSDSSVQEKKCNCKKEKEEDCQCKCNEECVEQNPCCAKITPYIAELFVVRDQVCKYEPGEMSYIKNIIKGESQERVHRNLERETIFSESIEEVKKYEENFQQVTDKTSVHDEMTNIIKDEIKAHAGATYGKKDGPGLFVEGSFDYQNNKERTHKIISDKSKEIIEKLTSRLERNVKQTNRTTLHRETEITNTSTLKGTDSDISRQFYYVNQVRKAQVFSYGKRTMLDFYLPEPSELLKRLVEKQFDMRKPEKPCINIQEIGTTKEDWLEFVQCYGFSGLEQPQEQPEGYWHYIPTYKKDPNDKHWSEPDTVIIPAGYTATIIEMTSNKLTPRFGATHHRLRVTFAGGMVQKSKGVQDKDDYEQLSDTCNATGSATLTLIGLALNKFETNIRLWFEPDPVDNLPWQLEVHKLLMEKCENDLANYNKALAEFEKSKENHFNKNPAILSEEMKEQLKHAAISYITCQFFDDNDAMKNKVEPCGFPQMDIPETKKEGEFVRFLEQAFEWKFMNYMLYPYFWARKCSWEDKFKEESENHLFTKFLQSGFARVSISVRPGFEDLISYYLQTRRIWGYGGVPPITGDAYVPIHQEIKESKDNFNADREGYLSWDSALNKDEIKLFDNLDYYTEDLDPITGNGLGTYTFDPDKAKVDINREITINCVTYRIVDIKEIDPVSHTIKFTLDRDLEVDCCCSGNGKEFDDVYLGRELPWSTGAVFIGAPWKFTIPTSLTWLREDGGCLPCYPIECEA